MRKHVLFVVLTFGLLGATPASSNNDQSNFNANTIREQQMQIRSDAEARTGRYKNLSETKRSELFARQERVSALLKDVEITTELPEVEQIELFNALESIEAIVNTADDDRMICERHKPVGSNRPRTICKTVAERRDEREEAQRDIGHRNQICTKRADGFCD